MIELLHPFAISFLIGLLIGIERERSHPAGLKVLGVRTFVLVALLGTLAAWFNDPTLSTAISIFVFAAILLGYVQESQTQRRERMRAVGLTTELSAAIVFCLGFITIKQPLLAAILGATVLLVLLGRKRLHDFSRKQIHPDEIQAAVTIIIIALGILPFLPNHPIDPWGLFNLQRFGILVLLIALIQFGGYVAMRTFGTKLGVMFTGFFGGLVSSTTVFLNLPRIYHNRTELLKPITAAGILATTAMLIELTALLSAAAPNLLQSLFPTIAVMGILGFVMAFFIGRKIPNGHLYPYKQSPLDLKFVLRIAAFISSMTVLVALAKNYVGMQGAVSIAFLAGLFDVQGISLATASLYQGGKLSLLEAYSVIGAALLASFVTKFILLWVLSRNRFAVLTSILLFLMLISGCGIFYLAQPTSSFLQAPPPTVAPIH